MLNIIMFSIGIMYTPGPVNLLSFNNGLRSRLTAQIPFSLGVSSALCVWFMLVGYAGSTLADQTMQPYLGVLGCGFILYLAWKVFTSRVNLDGPDRPSASLTYRDGLLMQLLNPKSFMVVLPVATVQFPAADITGVQIAVWSALLSLLGFGAPMAYAVAGMAVGRRVARPAVFRMFNLLMGLLLVFVAFDIAYHHVVLPLGR